MPGDFDRQVGTGDGQYHRSGGGVEPPAYLIDEGCWSDHPRWRAVDRGLCPRDGQPEAVGGNRLQPVGIGREEHAAEHGQRGIGADGESDRVERCGQLGGGDTHAGGWIGHGFLLGVEQLMDAGEFAAGVGETVFQAAQVGVDQAVRGPRVRQRQQHPGDLRQRHADPAQTSHQAGRGDLPSGIPAVAGVRVHHGRDQ